MSNVFVIDTAPGITRPGLELENLFRQPDPCCPAPKSIPPAKARGRVRIWDLASNVHCSIVGTCLTVAEARKFATRMHGADAARMSDLEVHEAVVRIASDPDSGARELNKHLDRRHELAIRRFDRVKDEAGLIEVWAQAMAEGDIPGAYWAALTHRAATLATRQRAFGDVHMLSHMVGAANRADVRRLTELAHENAELKDKVERQQLRVRDLVNVKEAVIKRLEDRLASRLATEGSQDAAATSPGDGGALRGLAVSLRRQLDQTCARAASLRDQVERLKTALTQAETALSNSRGVAAGMADELATLEIRLAASSGNAASLQEQLHTFLRNRTILYCGGRRGNVEAIRQMVESAAGKLLHHDGGMEERKGLLPGLLQGADIVLFPVDCISHDAMGTVKRLARQAGKPYRALRTSSLGSFIQAIREEAVAPKLQAVAPPSGPPPSHFCVRHG